MAKEIPGQFPSRQAAIDHANKQFRTKFGNDIKFPDGDIGCPAHNILSAAWTFRVVDPLGEELGHYDVRCISEEVFWLGVSYRVKPIPSEALTYPRSVEPEAAFLQRAESGSITNWSSHQRFDPAQAESAGGLGHRR